MEQLVAQGGQFPTESAAHLVHGHAMGGSRGRGDEVGHRFGLAQIHLAVQESTLGVFPRSGGTASLPDKELHHLLENVARTVAGDFRRVFSRVGMRASEKADQHFVDNLSFRTKDVAEGEGIGFAFSQRFTGNGLENAVGEGDGFRTRHADGADGSTLGGSDGTDGILGL